VANRNCDAAGRNSATFAYTAFGISQSKLITREIFQTPGHSLPIKPGYLKSYNKIIYVPM
jgi:hypothetical protein